MSALASLLVRDDALPVTKVQEAIQRQVLRGGSLDTVILEIGGLPENAVNAYCAAVYGMMPATRDEVMTVPLELTRLLPREFAVKHRIIPVSKDANTLVLAVDRPLADLVLEEIGRELGLEIVQRLVTSLRLEAGLSHHYDIELTSRMRALCERLDGANPGNVPYVAPYDGVNTRSSLPPSDSTDTGQTVLPRRAVASEPRTPRPRQGSPVPSGTFSSSQELETEPAAEVADVNQAEEPLSTQYSVPPPPPEVLGRPFSSQPPMHSEVRQPESKAPELNGSNGASVRTLARVSTPLPDPRRVPSVIVEVGQDIERLMEALGTATPEDTELLLQLVVSSGERALPAMVREFPGPLWFNRNQPFESIPRGRDISAIARVFVAFGDRAVPYVVSMLDRPNPDHRFYSTLLASEFVHESLVVPLGRRLFDSDREVAVVAQHALRNLRGCQPEFDQLCARARTIAAKTRDLEAQKLAIEVLGKLGVADLDTLNLLCKGLDHEDEDVAKAAYAALVRLCCQDFGRSSRKWRTWIAKNRDSHRVEWLIDGLNHQDLRLRRRAANELRHLTHEYFGYHPGLPKHDREVAQRKYRSWWTEYGRRRFA